MNNYEAHDFIKDDIIALINFIKQNMGKLEKWSLVLVNKGKIEVPDLLGDFYINQKLQVCKPISPVIRKSKLENYDSTLYFPSILDRQTDNIFDIIDKNNIDEYNDTDNFRQSDVVKKYRNKSGKPILLVYPTYTEEYKGIDIIPLLYCFIPIVDGAKKVTYIVRNK